MAIDKAQSLSSAYSSDNAREHTLSVLVVSSEPLDNQYAANPFELLSRTETVKDNLEIDQIVIEADGYLKQLGWLLQTLVEKLPRVETVHFFPKAIEDFRKFYLPAILLAGFYGRKIIINLPSGDFYFFLQRWGKWLRPFLSRAERLIVNSVMTKNLLENLQLKAVQDSIFIPADKISERQIRQLQPKIFISADHLMKNDLITVLNAYDLVKQKYPRTELIIRSCPFDLGELADRADLRNISGIELYDDAFSREACMNLADLYLEPASIEINRQVLLQAAASGLPVISTQAGQMDDFLADFQKSITFIPFNEFVSLSRKIIDLIEDPERVEKLTRAGRETARSYYWHRVKNNWLGRYR